MSNFTRFLPFCQGKFSKLYKKYNEIKYLSNFTGTTKLIVKIPSSLIGKSWYHVSAFIWEF
jgi:hypothetical protein